jgi:hypothetical protein
MWMDAYVEDILIRERLAEARRNGARQRLLHSARPSTANRGPWAVMQHFVQGMSRLWPKGRKERMAA